MESKAQTTKREGRRIQFAGKVDKTPVPHLFNRDEDKVKKLVSRYIVGFTLKSPQLRSVKKRPASPAV